MKKAIINMTGPSMAPILACAEPTFNRFAELHGYDVVIDRDVPDNPDYHSRENKAVRWGRLAMMERTLHDYDLVLHMDGDAMFTEFDRDIADDLQPDSFQGFTVEVSSKRFRRGFNPNAGVWIARRDPEMFRFLGAVLKIGMDDTGTWAEQEAISRVLGWEMTTNPDGSHTSKPVHYSPFLARTDWLPSEWNPTGLARNWPGRVLHCAGMKNEQRLPIMQAKLAELREEGKLGKH